jgi:polar amino acid transport system ATP-binding protein
MNFEKDKHQSMHPSTLAVVDADRREYVIEAVKIAKSFGRDRVLDEVTLKVGKGEVVAIIGPSGSGKSTFLRTLNWLERPDEGEVRICGQLIGVRELDGKRVPLRESEIARQRRDVAMVFQQFNLFGHLTALENISIAPIHVLGVPPREAIAQAEDALMRVGLPEKRGAYPHELSGGQQQRVGIARALAMKPKAILFDEPTSSLDPESVSEVLVAMTDLSRSGMTMIVVTHEMGFARQAANRVVFLDGGKILEEAPPQEFFDSPTHLRTKRFLGKVVA